MMKIIDSHVHIWTKDTAFPWAKEERHPPTYNAHPEDLLRTMEETGVAGTVLVQYIGYRWDNSYTAQAMKKYPGKFQGVCRVNPEDPDAPEHLRYWTKKHGFHGVRLSPAVDARGDWFTGSLMVPLFYRAAELGVPLLLLTRPPRLPDLVKILDRVSDIDVVIDHVADSLNASVDHFQYVLDLAHYPRVFIKLGHVWANSAEAYPWRDVHTRIKLICEVFGIQRVMWGSDWPLCLQHASYQQALRYALDDFDGFSPEERAWLAGKTAMQLWNFSE